MDKNIIIEYLKNSLDIELKKNGKSILYTKINEELQNNINNIPITLKDPSTITDNQYYIPFHIHAKTPSISLKIPYIIFQTWSLRLVTKNMYKTIYDNLIKNPNFEYYLFDDNNCLEFLQNNFSEEIVCAYNRLAAPAYKADLWRYCVIYKYGGVYSDIKFQLDPLKELIDTHGRILIRDREGDNELEKRRIYNALFILEKDNELLLKLINKILENIDNNYYGPTTLYPTGPDLFGSFVFDYGKDPINFIYPDTKLFSAVNDWTRDPYLKEGIFKAYPEYRADQQLFYSTLTDEPDFIYPENKEGQKTRHYDTLWRFGKDGEGNSIMNKRGSKFYKGIYKSIDCIKNKYILDDNDYMLYSLVKKTNDINNNNIRKYTYNLYNNIQKDIMVRINNILKPQLPISLNEYYVPFHIPARNKCKTTSTVPLIIFQTWMSHMVPKDMYKTIYDNLIKNPCFDYYLFDDDDCAKFIIKNFNKQTHCAFNNLVAGAYKADLWRYCILYKFGGVYLDIKFKIMLDLKDYIEKYGEMLVIDKDSIKNQRYDIYQAVMILNKNNKFLDLAITEVIKNVKTNYYGIDWLAPTGPYLLGNIVNNNMKDNLKKTELETVQIKDNENIHIVCNRKPSPNIDDISIYPSFTVTQPNGNKIKVICKDDASYLFVQYETYRDEQKGEYEGISKHYADYWKEAKPYIKDGIGINIPKNDKGEYTLGIYKTNNIDSC